MIKECKNCERVYQTESDLLLGTSRWRLCSEGHLWFNCSCQSTLFIQRGKHSFYAPDKLLSDQAKSLFNYISDLHKLPYIPSSVMTLLTMAQDPEVEVKDLAKKVRLEPLVASKVLAIAENLHSQRNPGNKPLDSIEHAIVYIGRKAIEEILTLASLGSFPVHTKVFSLEKFWQDAHITASLAEALAKRFAPKLLADEVFLSGFLCNVGKLVQAICFPEKSDEVTTAVQNPKNHLHWRKAERRLDAHSHCVLGEIGAAMWGLPTFIIDVCSHHHGVPNSNFNNYELIAVITFANQLLHWLTYQPERIDNHILDACTQFFGLDQKSLDNMVADLMPIKDSIKTFATAS